MSLIFDLVFEQVRVEKVETEPRVPQNEIELGITRRFLIRVSDDHDGSSTLDFGQSSVSQFCEDLLSSVRIELAFEGTTIENGNIFLISTFQLATTGVDDERGWFHQGAEGSNHHQNAVFLEAGDCQSRNVVGGNAAVNGLSAVQIGFSNVLLNNLEVLDKSLSLRLGQKGVEVDIGIDHIMVVSEDALEQLAVCRLEQDSPPVRKTPYPCMQSPTHWPEYFSPEGHSNMPKPCLIPL